MTVPTVNPDTVRADLNVETWEAATASGVSVNRYDKRGGEKAIMVNGGKRFQISTAEREELNEERAATPDLDPFRNGFLRPVRMVPSDVMERFATETLTQGGHTVEQLLDLLDIDGQPFVHAVAALNEATLRRLADLAPEADAKASQIGAIQERLEHFKINLRQTEADRINQAAPKGQ